MKVLFYRHSLLSRGGDRMTVAHAEYLAQHGWEVEIRTSRLDTVLNLSEELRVTVDEDHGKLGTLWRALMTRFDADRVVVDIIPLACLVAVRNRKSLVYFAQDYDEEYYLSPVMKLFVRLLYFLGLIVFRVPVIAVSDYLAKLLRQRFSAQVDVVSNGVDRRIFFSDPDTMLKTSKGNRKAILIHSRHDGRKGTDRILEIISRVIQKSPGPVVLWSVGEPFDRDDLGIIDVCDFGYVEEAFLRRIMSSADLFLYPTRHEGFGLMPLEALACGCPVVTTSAVKVLSHEVNALISAVDDVESLAIDAVRTLMEPGLSERLVADGIGILDKFSLDRSKADFAAALGASRA